MPSNHEEKVNIYAARRRANIESRAWAKRNREPWTDDDDDFLLREWINVPPDGRDEVTVSMVLERTIESCRVRCELIRERLGIKYCERGKDKGTDYIGVHDDSDDQWWSPDYYKQG